MLTGDLGALIPLYLRLLCTFLGEELWKGGPRRSNPHWPKALVVIRRLPTFYPLMSRQWAGGWAGVLRLSGLSCSLLWDLSIHNQSWTFMLTQGDSTFENNQICRVGDGHHRCGWFTGYICIWSFQKFRSYFRYLSLSLFFFFQTWGSRSCRHFAMDHRAIIHLCWNQTESLKGHAGPEMGLGLNRGSSHLGTCPREIINHECKHVP